MREGFPAVTTKKLAWKSVVSELLWFLSGSDNIEDLRIRLHGEQSAGNFDKKTIWDLNYFNQGKELGYAHGFTGDIYGVQWRSFNRMNVGTGEYVPGADQVKSLIEEAKVNPSSRRLVVSAWNPNTIWDNVQARYNNKPILPPCHYTWQVNIVGDFIDLSFTQRSVDTLLGLPFNIASYALLCHILGKILNKTPRYLVGNLGNTHLYLDHTTQALLQIQREPKKLPELQIPEFETLEQVLETHVDEFKLVGYTHHPVIKAQMAV